MKLDKKGGGRAGPIPTPVLQKTKRHSMAMRTIGVGLCALAVSAVSIDALLAKGGGSSGGGGGSPASGGGSGGKDVASLKGVSPLPRDVSKFIKNPQANGQPLHPAGTLLSHHASLSQPFVLILEGENRL